ncbi:MAG: bifunctional adenosylcobinamide kinase/adenosylcobinamide-phosphate guanylyltransferase [Hyphomicrobiaceae bacterium]|nr:bifunctional adenosylcobinamide kinase/adenosylcobinamide-phosphate guanylyltransferase [Hyphomicrobiaceae bacterium]
MMIPAKFLILGGARSGKTRHAMRLAEQQPRRIYIATAQALDDEMRDRIRHHQAERDTNWVTIEAPIRLADAISSIENSNNTAIVVDCLTLWLSNLIDINANVECETHNLLESITRTENRLVIVSNEVGLGIVPANALARKFCDMQGHLNQRIAKSVDYVDLITAGFVLNLKPGIAR